MDDEALTKIALAMGFHVEGCRGMTGVLKDAAVVRRSGQSLQWMPLADFRLVIERAKEAFDELSQKAV